MFPVRLYWRELVFHLLVAPSRDSFWARDVDLCLLLSASGYYPIKTCAGPAHVATICEFSCLSVRLCLEGFYFLVFSILIGSYIFSASYSTGFSEL